MGFLTPPDRLATAPSAEVQALEIVMLSQGLRLQIGPHPDDLCRIEDLSIGEAVWDIAAQRLVDIDAMACATLDGEQLADLGLRPMPVPAPHGLGFLALASTRLVQRDSHPAPATGGAQVFFRLWPVSRLVAEIEGRPVLIRSA
ncbi:hypothetical protein GU927_012385 [Rhodobacteraceae bacterium HSP-20]|uniref:RES domain-containing protein n=1 Tax=Paragemmobacter amnigenus TaxID=2852097 RepID=A0ABS6J575_9RHOB|nr:hypothetical protein [Rhodobacter amnigenus]MBU9698642.1 hypothetical protein [Rhodobacter amnigenus]MBV4389869.1 hypothetical protein [Rhodobacter amnigenus]